MSYQKRLKEFFSKHDPDRIYLAAKIARTFRGDEDTVFNRLEEIYNTGGPSSLTYKEIAPKPVPEKLEGHDDVAESIDAVIDDAQPVKKKGKLKKIIILILAVAVLGGGGYFGYDMFFAGHDDASHEEVSEDDHGDASHDEGHDTSHESSASSDVSHDAHDVLDSAHNESDSTHTEGADSTQIENSDSTTIQDIKDAAEALHVLGM